MTINQEEALYDFLDNVSESFDLEMVMAYLRLVDSTHISHAADEVRELINERRLAFVLGNRQWVSRRGYFETMPFVISPTRLELMNGILIPGHRCVPFANPNMLPQEYVFHWKGSLIPSTTTEGDPGEFYPYYSIFGEEYAPQYVARDNPDNEAAFNSDPYEDPPEVSISTLDMRNIYRETSFVPGDRFVARTMDWNKGIFSLERVSAGAWDPADLYAWFESAEAGFEDSFCNLGPGTSTEEQAAFAYWYGGKRMRQIPAYSLEEFLYEKTDIIEIEPYGIESRFWYTGREIPDMKSLDGLGPCFGRTKAEEFLCGKKIPISEYVVDGYLRDFLFRRETDVSGLIDRIIPPAAGLSAGELKHFEIFLNRKLREVRTGYSEFQDKFSGPMRQRIGELHTAVIELTLKLEKENIDPSWLPKHTYIILSQIQGHAAGVLEDLDSGENSFSEELEAMDSSIDSMIETYEDIKNLIEEALENFRMNRFSLVKRESGEIGEWLVQLGIGGTEVWRRITLSEDNDLEDLHRIIQNIFQWKNSQIYQFSGGAILDKRVTIGELGRRGLIEFLYEYGAKWTVKIMLLTRSAVNKESPARCTAGEGAAPPEDIGGPLRFRRSILALSGINSEERTRAKEDLGRDFKPDVFDIESCNRNLSSSMAAERIFQNSGKGE